MCIFVDIMNNCVSWFILPLHLHQETTAQIFKRWKSGKLQNVDSEAMSNPTSRTRQPPWLHKEKNPLFFSLLPTLPVVVRDRRGQEVTVKHESSPARKNKGASGEGRQGEKRCAKDQIIRQKTEEELDDGMETSWKNGVGVWWDNKMGWGGKKEEVTPEEVGGAD